MGPLHILALMGSLALEVALIFAMKDSLTDHPPHLWAHLPPPVVVLFASGFLALWLSATWVIGTQQVRAQPGRISEAETKTSDSKPEPSERGVSSTYLSKHAATDSDSSEEETTATDRLKEDTSSISASTQGGAGIEPPRGELPPNRPSQDDDPACDLPEEDIPTISPPKEDVELNKPSEQEAAPSLLRENAVANSNQLDKDVPHKGPVAQQTDPEDDAAREKHRLLDEYAESLCGLYEVIEHASGFWLELADLVLKEQGDPHALPQFDPFRDQSPDQVGPLLKVLQGPVRDISESVPINTETNPSFCDIIGRYISQTDGMDECLGHYASVIKTAFELNESAITQMRQLLGDSGFCLSVLGRFISLTKLIDRNSKRILARGGFIDGVLIVFDALVRNRQRKLVRLESIIMSDHLIALIDAPSGWETLDAKSGGVQGDQESAQRARDILARGLCSVAAAPADMVSNVYELSRMFKTGSRKKFDLAPETVARGPSLFSDVTHSPRTVETTQHAEEMNQVRKAQEDLEKLRVKIECTRREHEASRTYQEATVKDHESKSAQVMASAIDVYVENRVNQLVGESVYEECRKLLGDTTGLDSQELSIKVATAVRNYITSADGE